MCRSAAGFLALPLLLFFLTGCHGIGDKSASLSIIYCAAAVLSLALLIVYCAIARKKDPWFLLLFASVLVVNVGYLALAVSQGLEEALLANRVAYLGSVFLPLSMFMIILNVSRLHYSKWIPTALLVLGVIVFLIAASPGYLDIYYKEVSFAKVNGVTVLDKVYGPLHGIYLIYLLGYFTAMVAAIIHATLRDRIESIAYATVLAIAVFVNIGVWMIEQLVRIDFEFLSISYIISESFLLGLNLFMAETQRQKEKLLQQMQENGAHKEPEEAAAQTPASPAEADKDPAREAFLAGLSELTAKERQIFDCYIAGMSTVEIMEKLNIKENTLKFHNKNLYGKLGVPSRRKLVELHRKVAGK